MKNKLVWKFIAAFALLVLVSVLILNFFVGIKLKDDFEGQFSKRLHSSAILVSEIVGQNIQAGDSRALTTNTSALAAKLGFRITVLAPDGRVLGDSDRDPVEMDNHLSRPEVRRALEGGLGQTNRFSDTLNFNMKYLAVPITINNDLLGIVRLAMPLGEVELQIKVIYRVVLMGGVVAVLFMMLLGSVMSGSIIRPIVEMKEVAQAISEGDFSKRIKLRSDDELGVLASSLNLMADELQQKIQNLNQLDRMRTDFVANVSHELKTPLTSIRGFIETLEDGAMNDPENAKRFLSIIKKNAEALSHLTNDLLQLAELESGQETLIKEPVDMTSLASEVVAEMAPAASDRKQELIVQHRGRGHVVPADTEIIKRVLINLLDNAIKYTEQGGRIALTVDGQDDVLLLIVEDNGSGIPERDLKRVFERFYRVDKARSRTLGSTGLGLAIAKHAVQLHGGEISIHNRPGGGTRVELEIPR